MGHRHRASAEGEALRRGAQHDPRGARRRGDAAGVPLCGVGQVAETIPPASLPDPSVLQRSLPAPKGRHLAACASRTAVKTAWNQCGTARDTFELLGQPGMHRLDQRSAALLTFPLAVLGWRGADVGLDLIECGDPQAPPIIIRRNLWRCR